MPRNGSNINELLPPLYAAACGEEEWDVFLDLLGRAARTTRVHITYVRDTPHPPKEGPFSATRQWIKHVGLSEEVLADAIKYAPIDPWWLALLRGPFPEGWVGRGSDLKPIDEMIGTDYYEKVLRKHDYIRPAIAVLLKRPGEVAACGMGRRQEDEEFEDDVLDLLRELTPHMARAIRVFNKTGQVQQNLDSVEFALEQFAIGVFVLDSNGALIFANATARQQIEFKNGLMVEEAKLKAVRRRESDYLRACIGSAIRASEASRESRPGRAIGVAPVTGLDGEVLHAFIAPWLTERQLALRKPAAVLLMTHPQGRIPRETWLQTLYGLTKSEARIATLVAGGMGGPEAAAKLGVTGETIRTRLKTVFSKTSTRRQSDLARLLASLPRG